MIGLKKQKRDKDQTKRGSLTVEAAIIFPIFFLVIFFVISFLNLFYLHLVVQQALTNTGLILAQYGYVVDKTVGLSNFGLNEETKKTETGMIDEVTKVLEDGGKIAQDFSNGISIDRLPTLVADGQAFVGSVSNLANTLKKIDKKMIVNYLLASAVDGAGGYLVSALIGNYLDEMQINKNLIPDGIYYKIYLDNIGSSGQKNDILLIGYYTFKNPLFSLFTDGIPIRQIIRIHPWTGGTTKGLS